MVLSDSKKSVGKVVSHELIAISIGFCGLGFGGRSLFACVA